MVVVVMRENKLPIMELEHCLSEKPDYTNFAKEFFFFVEKREPITAKVMIELLAQNPGAARVQEWTKMNNPQT
jgi:hypothetical protein